MGKATIEGLKVTEKEKDAEELTLDEILENTRQAHVIELELSKEATRLAMGESSDEYIYNIPRLAEYGKEDWGTICDKMPRGYCSYRANKQKHIHTLGVNINGAVVIMNAYMGLKIEPSDPEIKEFTMFEDGKLISKSYWYVSVKGVNKKTETELSLPFMQPVLKKTGKLYIFDEYGPQIAVSKAIRNLILKIVPGNFQQAWIQDYMSGTKKEKPKEKPVEKPAEKPTEKATNGELTIDSAIEHIKTIENTQHLTNWFNKNKEWFNKLKPVDKQRFMEAFNAHLEALKKPENENMATTEQFEEIKKIAQELGYDPDQLDAICMNLTGSDDIPGMSFENAGLILAELQKTANKRKNGELV